MTRRIWITRTEPGASRLGKKLQELGYLTLIAPVYKVIPAVASELSVKTDLWVFVSTHAVTHATYRTWDKTKPTIAVGPATASQLETLGIEPLIPNDHSSEGIYELIRSRFDRGLCITIVSGNDGREDLANWLERDGYRYRYWVVYRREFTDVDLGIKPISAIVVASAIALARVREHLAKKNSVSIPIVVPSSRYCELAKSLGFREIHVAEGASDTATVNTLNTIFFG